MKKSEWRVRLGGEPDRDLLASFTCADPAVPFQAEVEQFCQRQLLDWALAPGAAEDDPRLLLLVVTATGDLIGVAAHERKSLHGPSGAPFNATVLEVIALATKWQGRSFESGERASDVLMSAVMVDVASRVPPRDAHVLAVVHEENERSLGLLRRHGLTQEMSRPAPEYRRFVTP